MSYNIMMCPQKGPRTSCCSFHSPTGQSIPDFRSCTGFKFSNFRNLESGLRVESSTAESFILISWVRILYHEHYFLNQSIHNTSKHDTSQHIIQVNM